MSQPDFKAMSQKELHAYVLAHRDNQEAFYRHNDLFNFWSFLKICHFLRTARL